MTPRSYFFNIHIQKFFALEVFYSAFRIIDSWLLFTTCRIVLIPRALSRGVFLQYLGSPSALLTNRHCVFSNVFIAPGLIIIVAHPYTNTS